ncbi:MAG: tRNA (guanosine(46)-N7)-methyltransferase TrmB [Gammaproteobacteria bacterium]|nr:MAG: tRNA (guanosine(46)-N7)-methyltransferase TrmB [Gammaproteobacteria bacterium]
MENPLDNKEPLRNRKIRSFVKREGRLTNAQEKALGELLPEFGVDHIQGPLDFNSLYDNDAEVILEIGFGMGHSLVEQAEANPQLNYLGIEVHSPGVGSLLKSIAEKDINNIRVSNEDAVEVMANKIPEQSLKGVQLFFPDPWHKKKHHKRRLVNASFVEALAKRIKPDGFFHLATDWENYAEHMLEVMSATTSFKNLSEKADYIPRPVSRPLTKFEKRGQRLGHGVWDLMFIRKSS